MTSCIGLNWSWIPLRRNVTLRSYLKSLAKEAWDYVSWLTHEKNAIRSDGDLAVEMTAHSLSLFEQVIERREFGVPDRCPTCGSYRLGVDWRIDEEDAQIVQAQVCEVCAWFQEMKPEPLRRPDDDERDAAQIEGECLPSSDL